MLTSYLRAEGRKGNRNVLVVAYLVECRHHVAREIATPFRDRSVHLIGIKRLMAARAAGLSARLTTGGSEP